MQADAIEGNHTESGFGIPRAKQRVNHIVVRMCVWLDIRES